MRFIFSSLIALVVLQAGCSKPSPEDYMGKATVAINEGNFNVAIEEFEKLIADHPRSAQAEEAMLAVARIQADELKDYTKAIASYRRYLDTYPDGTKAPEALFLIGYLYHNELNDLENARTMYEQFLEKYPKHDMAASAKFELENLGKKPEELLPLQQEPPPVAVKSPSKKPKTR